MTQDELKRDVAKAALDFVEENSIIGVGSGSTIHYFIEYLALIKDRIEATVASSIDTEKRLKAQGIPVVDFNSVSELALYIDGADACTPHRVLVKGGGAALTREKILATASKEFICIVDESKKVDILGEFPVPIEVIPMARSYVAREIVKLGGNPVYRQNVTTDNGNVILDVHNWLINEPLKLERTLNNIPGVVCAGIFADRTADVLLVSTQTGMKVLGASQALINKLLK
jgi:ribose 5-phosphate isomerase A